MVEEQPQAVVIGQAENAPGTIALARSLRPDVVIIDSHLPHTVALAAVPLTQIGGLDTAQTATQEIPNTRVVLVNTDTIPGEGVMSSDFVPLFFRETGGKRIPFTLQELVSKARTYDSPVFASIQLSPGQNLKNLIFVLCDKAMLAGIIAVLLGLIFIVTLFLALPGFFIAIAGAVLLVLGSAAKILNRLWYGLGDKGYVRRIDDREECS
jgi:CheY-like chemotaxis protein